MVYYHGNQNRLSESATPFLEPKADVAIVDEGHTDCLVILAIVKSKKN